MINFSQRLDSEKVVFKKILNTYPAKTALDSGCGSGFHSVLLSQLNLKVTGIDNSLSMLKLAQKNAKKYKVNPFFKRGNFLVRDSHLKDKFDVVFCLGNSFVHLLTEEDQTKSLMNFKYYLKNKGYLCLQIVNYDKILKNKQTVLAVRTINNRAITRSYTFQKNTVIFTVKIETEKKSKEISTELYPMQSNKIQSLLQKTGFNKIKLYGDLMFSPYKKYDSENICIFCRCEQ